MFAFYRASSLVGESITAKGVGVVCILDVYWEGEFESFLNFTAEIYINIGMMKEADLPDPV